MQPPPDDGIEMASTFEQVMITVPDPPPAYNQPASAATVELDDRLTKASNADADAWCEAYKKLMAKSIGQIHVLLAKQSWNIIEPAGRINLYERPAEPHYYTLKAVAILNVRPERLLYVMNDHDQRTRLPWDSKNIDACHEWESFMCDQGKIRVVSSQVIMMNMPLVWNRSLLGIQWSAFDPVTRTYKLVFRSTQHRFHRNKEGTVAVNALVGAVIRVLDTKKTCELNIVMHVNPGDGLPTVLAEQCKKWLRSRIELYEKVVLDWDTYYGKKNDPKVNRM